MKKKKLNEDIKELEKTREELRFLASERYIDENTPFSGYIKYFNKNYRQYI